MQHAQRNNPFSFHPGRDLEWSLEQGAEDVASSLLNAGGLPGLCCEAWGIYQRYRYAQLRDQFNSQERVGADAIGVGGMFWLDLSRFRFDAVWVDSQRLNLEPGTLPLQALLSSWGWSEGAKAIPVLAEALVKAELISARTLRQQDLLKPRSVPGLAALGDSRETRLSLLAAAALGANPGTDTGASHLTAMEDHLNLPAVLGQGIRTGLAQWRRPGAGYLTGWDERMETATQVESEIIVSREVRWQ